jgi:hypothetical protein
VAKVLCRLESFLESVVWKLKMMLVNPTIEEAALALAKNKDTVRYDRVLSTEELTKIQRLWAKLRRNMQLHATVRNGTTTIEEK